MTEKVEYAHYRGYWIDYYPHSTAFEGHAEVWCGDDKRKFMQVIRPENGECLRNNVIAYIDFLHDRSSDEDEQRAKHLDAADRSWLANQDNYEEEHDGTESDE